MPTQNTRSRQSAASHVRSTKFNQSAHHSGYPYYCGRSFGVCLAGLFSPSCFRYDAGLAFALCPWFTTCDIFVRRCDAVRARTRGFLCLVLRSPSTARLSKSCWHERLSRPSSPTPIVHCLKIFDHSDEGGHLRHKRRATEAHERKDVRQA